MSEGFPARSLQGKELTLTGEIVISIMIMLVDNEDENEFAVKGKGAR